MQQLSTLEPTNTNPRPKQVKWAVTLLVISTIISMSNLYDFNTNSLVADEHGDSFVLFLGATTLTLWLSLALFIFIRHQWARFLAFFLILIGDLHTIYTSGLSIDLLTITLTSVDIVIFALLLHPHSAHWFSWKKIEEKKAE